MLVLTRSCDEEIRIGDDVIVRVLDVKGDRVRIGIQAPSEIPVHRQEVYEEIERANRESIRVETDALAAAQKLVENRNRSRSTNRKSGSGKNTEVKHGT